MRKLIAAAITSLVLIIATLSPVGAHSAPPCNDSGEPGNSDYARHHIVPLATTGGLGDGGHKPGSHRGFSLCDPSGN